MGDEGEDEPEFTNDMLKAWSVREEKLRADAEVNGTKIDWEAEKRAFVEQWNATHGSVVTVADASSTEDNAAIDTSAGDSSSQPDTASVVSMRRRTLSLAASLPLRSSQASRCDKC